MPRLQITLTGDRADRFEARKERMESKLGTDLSRSQMVAILMDGDVSDDPPLIEG